MTQHSKEKMEKAIQNAHDCYKICLETLKHCLEKGGEHAEHTHIESLSDCAEMCLVSEHFMIEQSKFHPQLCEICADACKECAESCEKFSDDAQMQECAEACVACEKTCREMSADQ
jgi:hypothetical protein